MRIEIISLKDGGIPIAVDDNMKKQGLNKWGNPYKLEPDCNCKEPKPDMMFFGGLKKPGTNIEGIYCHCNHCGGKVWFDRRSQN